MPKKDKQREMDLSYTYSVKEMGILIGEKIVHLFDSFIREKLGGSIFDAQAIFEKKDSITKVGCPFCKEGFLKLEKVEPDYSGGPHAVPMTLHHVGNKYEYSCSNSNCPARFYGTHTWMYID